MKNFLFSLIFACACLIPAHAQWSLGVEAGMSVNSLTYDTGYFYNMHYFSLTGYSLAVPVQYSFKDWFAVRAELAYLQKNFGYEVSGDGTGIYEFTSTNYLDIPLMARFSFGGKRLRGFLDLGGYVGGWLSGHETGRSYITFSENPTGGDTIFDTYTAYDYSVKYEFDKTRDNRFEAGLLIGVGLQWQVTRLIGLNISCRYWYGLTDMQKNYMRNQTPRYHNTFTTQAGVMFTIPQK